MSAHTVFGRLAGCSALSVAGAMMALAMASGVAGAMPRTPLAVDDPAPAVPFDPGALLNAIDDYMSLLSMLTGGQSAPAGLDGAGSVVPAPAGSYPLLPGVP